MRCSCGSVYGQTGYETVKNNARAAVRLYERLTEQEVNSKPKKL